MGAEGADEREQFVSQAIRQIAAGGTQAQKGLTALYRSYRRPMLSFLMRKGLPLAAAEDTLQDVFIKLTRSAAQCQHDGGAAGWLWRIVVNAANDVHRSRSHEVDVDDETQQRLEAQLPERGSGGSHAIDDCVGGALQRFSRHHPERADAVRLMHLEEWSGTQVAAFLGRSPGATREFLSQCRRAFAPYVEPCRQLLAH